MYLFTHETLRLVAEQQYGSSLVTYRNRLHTWTDNWRQRGWPPGTPQYLLRSYPRMIASTGDLLRLVACATDHVRHDRMRDLTGGDALALTEISTAQQLILAQPDPDLTSLAFLAVQREHLTDRNSNIPIKLPAVWAQIGETTRAEALAKSITNPYEKAQGLTRLAATATTAGEHERAARLASEAEALTQQITNPDRRAGVLIRLATLLMSMSNETSQVPEHARGRSPLMVRTRHLLAVALVNGSWTESVASLAHVDPAAVAALADEVLVRWGLDSSDDTGDNRER
ncbi:MAG: hypothetical protein M3291_00635 [Actinomycetota bacterium]|nr:hypothetical protein [Actinomycetota bacterium]MDQ4032241.1 hypothetical protein [Actinomycetota bacterium]